MYGPFDKQQKIQPVLAFPSRVMMYCSILCDMRAVVYGVRCVLWQCILLDNAVPTRYLASNRVVPALDLTCALPSTAKRPALCSRSSLMYTQYHILTRLEPLTKMCTHPVDAFGRSLELSPSPQLRACLNHTRLHSQEVACGVRLDIAAFWDIADWGSTGF